jgi:assimilatory nitrate reductase catalytic subunit
MIDEVGGIQWPFPDAGTSVSAGQSGSADSKTTAQERRLFEDGVYFHPDRKAKFLFEPPREVPEATDSEYPFVLLTGRGTSSQWHTQTRTGKSAVLKKLYPREIYVELNPADAEGLGISANEKVWIESRRGRTSATAFITNTVQKGQVFVPMHYVAANELTFPAVDPYSRQPAYKACGVSLRRAEL